MTPYQLACKIINNGNVQQCKFAPRGDAANAVSLFMGRPAGHEIFITEAQAEQFKTLLAGKPIIMAGNQVSDNRFAGFVKTIYSDKTKKNYYLLTFCGVVAIEEQEPASAPTATPCTLAGMKAASADQAHAFAAKLITGAIAKGYAKKDERAQAGDDYLCVWLTKAQSDTLLGLLACVPTAINQSGNIITQPVGAFCYWSKVKAQSGSILLCWMGEVPATVETVKAEPAAVLPSGKLIPMDMDIPF